MSPYIFGVRHLSPAAALHLEKILDTLQPTAVLVEGPSDADPQIPHLVHPETRPPLAVLAYTQERPIRSLLYPLAAYSPEWAALTWGIRHGAEVRFIDLPASVFLELHVQGDQDRTPAKGQPSEHSLAYSDDPYEAIARLAGEGDHETWWERHFEHTIEPDAYHRQIFEFGRGLRAYSPQRADQQENLLRESFMRRCLVETLARGHRPEKILVVCGAFHASALTDDLEPMTDKEVAALPRVATSLTLMPYSYYRLSSQSGYGAGNHAPAYYQALFEESRTGRPERLPSRFLTELCHTMRRGGQIRSPAEVIEAVRLASSLAALADASAPSLRDLRDAAITCLGRGDEAAVRPFLSEVEIGHSIGSLPKGIGRTSLQDDFYLSLESLKLHRYQTDQAHGLELDLRENRFVKNEASAFLDRNRSTFLHRLRLLGVAFADPQVSEQNQATWKECWRLHWTPECEIQLVESALKGDTVELAADFHLSEMLGACDRIDQAAEIVKEAALCQLAESLEDARRRLQALAVEDSGFIPLGKTVASLAEIIRYGTVRRVDPEPLRPLLSQLFLRATLLLRQTCLCDRAAADEIRQTILGLNQVAVESEGRVDLERWNHELDGIAAADDLNPFLSGLACALVLEKGRLSESDLAREVSRRLSPGIDAEAGAGWIEGLVQYNRMALFSLLGFWHQLDAFIAGLDEDAFRHSLVFLRRAFAHFSPAEVRRVVSNLVEVASPSASMLKTMVDIPLDEEEVKKLQEQLGDLDLGI